MVFKNFGLFYLQYLNKKKGPFVSMKAKIMNDCTIQTTTALQAI